MNEYYTILAGVLLRIAIPLLVLLGLAVLLGRMDARWKRESLQQSKDLAVAVDDMPADWEAKNCPIEKAAESLAKKPNEPCWQVFRQENGDFDSHCLNCDVFLTSVAPIPEVVTTHH
jgi:hypothetical protein